MQGRDGEPRDAGTNGMTSGRATGVMREIVHARGPRFDRPIASGGYQWHYVDGVSDDGSSAIVVIALLGNPFSPGYARARRHGPASALRFSALNVALYSKGASAWSLEERRVTAGDRAATGLRMGASTMRWDGDRLVVDIHERTTPFGRPLRGTVVLHPEAQTSLEFPVDLRCEHRWWPVLPLARVEVDLASPGLRFSGHGYHDANAGDVPLEATFETWNWSRARSAEGAFLTYDVALVGGAERALAFKVSPYGEVSDLEHVRSMPLPRTAWGIGRRTRVDEGHEGSIARSLEDGPFYARALVTTRLGGAPVVAMHETLAAYRLRRRWVRALTAFRMRSAT